MMTASDNKARMLGRLFDCFSLYEAISTHIYKHKEDDTLSKKNNSTIFVDGVAYDCIRSMEDHKTELTCRANNLEGAIYAERERQADEKRRALETALQAVVIPAQCGYLRVEVLPSNLVAINGQPISDSNARLLSDKLAKMVDALEDKL